MFSNCGRKRRNIFSFHETKKTVSVNRLSLPAVRGVRVVSFAHGNKITWHALTTHDITTKNTKLIGYNIYRLTKAGFVLKHALNKEPITKNEFLNRISKNSSLNRAYLIRAIFKIQDETILGPASKIVRQ